LADGHRTGAASFVLTKAFDLGRSQPARRETLRARAISYRRDAAPAIGSPLRAISFASTLVIDRALDDAFLIAAGEAFSLAISRFSRGQTAAPAPKYGDPDARRPTCTPIDSCYRLAIGRNKNDRHGS